MESTSEMQKQKQVTPSRLTPEIQKFWKQIKAFFESIESDTYNLKMMVATFVDKIKQVLTKSNPVEVVEEFDKWLKIFTNEK